MKFKKLNERGFTHEITLMAFVVMFALAGCAYLVATHADPLRATNTSTTITTGALASETVNYNSDTATITYSGNGVHDINAHLFVGATTLGVVKDVGCYPSTGWKVESALFTIVGVSSTRITVNPCKVITIPLNAHTVVVTYQAVHAG